ncbi:zingipain-2-like [Nicotiana tabacum]|uniref:Zingipain-2-like n=1 Tax=Nicotiana tabacum TaxID=4097 RepID=A0AC58T3Y9_TOBAC
MGSLAFIPIGERPFAVDIQTLANHFIFFLYVYIKIIEFREHNRACFFNTSGLHILITGCCWAFSAVAAIEGAYQIANNELMSLSEQELLDCTTQNNGCNGGLMTRAYDFLLQNGGGITTETNYPYQQIQSVCSTEQLSSPAVKISGYKVVEPSESALLQAVANQPISVGIAANREFHLYGSGVYVYKSGIYDGSCYPQLNHAVTVIGYGTSEDGTNYWLIKNSWGTTWGEEGYMKIVRDVGVEDGHCGIAQIASFPTV